MISCFSVFGFTRVYGWWDYFFEISAYRYAPTVVWDRDQPRSTAVIRPGLLSGCVGLAVLGCLRLFKPVLNLGL